jgi:hypothetical protein
MHIALSVGFGDTLFLYDPFYFLYIPILIFVALSNKLNPHLGIEARPYVCNLSSAMLLLLYFIYFTAWSYMSVTCKCNG